MLYKEDLDNMQCSNPDCCEVHVPLRLHSRCHPKEPTWAWYEGGVIKIRCCKCDALVVEFAVASVFEKEDVGHA